jgi:hypothetical protein
MIWIQHYLNAGIPLVNRRVTPFVSYTTQNGTLERSDGGKAVKP